MKTQTSKTTYSSYIFRFLVCFLVPVIGLIYIFVNRKKWSKLDITFYLLIALTNLSLTITVTFFTRDFWIISIHNLICFIICIIFILCKKRSK